MTYCKYLDQETGSPRYAHVERRGGVLWAVSPMQAPPEDLAARLAPAVSARFAAAPLDSLELLAPVTPSKIVCIGRNYRDHVAELGHDLPKEPLLFLKPPSSLLAPNGVVRMPALSRRVDYEGELAIVIGRRASRLRADVDVRPYIRGYTIVNDVTARDLQTSDGQWSRAKGFDTFCPAGPIVSTEIDPVGGEPVTVTTRLNGAVKQQGSTRELIFPISVLLAHITAAMTLEPGDIIPTGTPAGVGPVQPGDVVEVEIDGIGVLRNSFQAE
ncbi:MAG: fumarylacetoacetate hydrolase family protein [Acidobacteriaceae bacterium]|nr:fumarylacetoacetate hydrolase family protein [Acidobacteriaceae bacterium]